MRAICDNDLPDEVAFGLRGDGHDVQLVRHALTAEASDLEIWSYAAREDRVVLTSNRDDFLELANLAIAARERFAGLIIVRQRGCSGTELPRVRKLLARAGEAGIAGNINYA